MKINFYTDGKSKVIATTCYKGEMVRGVAKCAPSDDFDLEIGERLAQLRCEEKVARKRCQDKKFWVDVSRKVLIEEKKDYERACNAFGKAQDIHASAVYDLRTFENFLRGIRCIPQIS